MKNEIVFLVSTDVSNVIRSLNNEKYLIKELRNNNKKIKILDLSKFSKINNKNYIKKLENNFGNFFELKIIKDLKFLDQLNLKNKTIFVNLVPIDINQFKVWRIIKKYRLFNILIQNDQFRRLREQENSEKNIKKSIFKTIFNFYYLFRILVILKYFPKIDLIFVATKNIKKRFESSIFNKIDKFFKFNLLSFFKKIEVVNIKFYNPKIISKSNYICYIDTAPFDHPALKKFSEEKINLNERNLFYCSLRSSLKKIKRYSKKKLIICLHPKYNFKYKKIDFANLKCKIFDTEKYINESYLTLFTSSSMILNAMILKKKIFQINSSKLPNYFKSENSHWNDLFNFTNLLIDNPNKLDSEYFNNLIKKANYKTKYYSKILKKIIHKENLSATEQIVKILEKQKI